MRLVEFTAARRIPMIGREELIREAERRIGRGGVHFLSFEGAGGTGKTALMEAILEQSQRGGKADTMANCRVAREVIDLYHVEVHTSEGLVRRITDVLGDWSFEQTGKILSGLDRARIAGDMDAVGAYSEALQTTFVDEFRSLTADGAVLAFDSLEVLEHERDPFQEELAREVPVPTPSASEWLFEEFFPALQGNALVLLSSRPGSLGSRLDDMQQRNQRLLVHHVPLKPLELEETLDFLRSAAQADGRLGDGDAAARLWTFCEERGEVAHLLTEGRPILLSILADLVARGWDLPPSFDRDLGEKEQERARSWGAEIERALVLQLLESPEPVGNTIRALGWLRKGATPELLARVMGLKTLNGEWDVYTVSGYLQQAGQLTVVQLQPGARRVFLHDELYALLDKHVFQSCREEERDQIHAAIQAYYWDLTRELERRVEQLPPGYAAIQARLRQAFVEEMHYRLTFSPPMGFAMYFWLAEDAVGGRDAEMDMMVRTEFLRTMGRLRETGRFAGLVPREAEMDAAVRWGLRALFLQSRPEAALKIFDQIRRRWGKDAGTLGLAWVHMQLYRALAKIHRAERDDWQVARDLLVNVEQSVYSILRTPAETPTVRGRRWQARIMRSLALNFRGYLDRQQGRYAEAVQNYQESAMLQRRLGMAALAPTLTNLSYALSLIGDFDHARLLTEEAERLARRTGKEHMLAMTLNVRALVEAQDHHHRAALRYTDRALEIAAKLPSFRVRGLIYMTRARARRYLWDTLTEAERNREPHFFDEALKEAAQAVKLLRNSPPDRVDALLERGCIYRELARVRHQEGRIEGAAQYAEMGKKDLERAAALAGAMDIPSQQALARTNLSWLYYYLEQREDAEKAVQQAYGPLPREYLFSSNGPMPRMACKERRNEASLPFWSTLGKAEMLRAYMALDEARAANGNGDKGDHLLAAVRHITYSLTYDAQVADAYFDLTRAEAGLHRRILKDDLSVRTLHRHAQAVAEEQGLEQPTRFQWFLNRMFGTADLWW
jgi:tetratricopeptide (TPR) repeat protein